VAGVTSYAYIQRFVKNKNYAIVGALLYAFSGFQIMNIFFNHFHDVVAFFPLMLIGIEEVVVNNKKGPFLIAVALSATISYFFFVGQVAFMVIYFFVRVSMCHSWKMTVKKFLILALEAIVGVMISAVILLPSILAIIDNPRLDSSLYGYNILFYNKVQRYGAIIQSFLFPAEIAARPNFFADHDAKWASMAGWFPLISLSGVMAYITSKKR
ncbi:MAG: YfhO family protein, partial [Oscillospiraceae bacterium]